MEKNQNLLAWVDVETTGLDAASDHLLEIALVLTTVDLEVIARCHAYVLYTQEDIEAMRRDCFEVVRDMHDRTGLWDKLRRPVAKTLDRIDEELCEIYETFVGTKPRGARLAGNSVRLDASFIEANLPKFADKLHYRIVDVSTLAFIAEVGYDITPFEKVCAHSAQSDIQESINEYEYLLWEMTGHFPKPNLWKETR